jgi:hypothetical protein
LKLGLLLQAIAYEGQESMLKELVRTREEMSPELLPAIAQAQMRQSMLETIAIEESLRR